jgi:hypothetical protein
LSPRRLALFALAAAAIVAAVLMLGSRPEPEAPAAPPSARAPSSASYDRPAAAPPVTPPAAPPLASRLLRAALVEQLRAAALSRESLQQLAAGDLATVARRLGAAREPGSAALLAELESLCQRLDEPAAESEVAEARAALGSASREPAAGAALDALVAARREAMATLVAGCAAARIDRTATTRQLELSARNGDAASLERLALAGTGNPGRLTSAALLGAPRAQLHLGLDQLRDQPAVARSWLEAAARQDADAAAVYGSCLLAGCGTAPDVAAGRAALESAARRGAPFALGLFASPPGADGTLHWAAAGAVVSPLPPPDPDALGLAATDRYAWAALAGHLAAEGCFGFDLRLAAEALAARPRVERAVSPAEAAAGQQAAIALEATSGAEIRRARGCD